MARTTTKRGLFFTVVAASLLCFAAFSSSAIATVLGQGPDNPGLLVTNAPYAATMFDYAPAGAPPGFIIGSYYLAADIGSRQTLIVDLAAAPDVSNPQALLLRDGVNPIYSVPVNGIQRLTFTPSTPGRYSVRIMASNVGTFTATSTFLSPYTPTVTRTPASSTKTYRRRHGYVKYTLGSTFRNPTNGAGVKNATVYLQTRTSTKRAWKNSYRMTTNAYGSASKAFRSTRRSTTYYRWVVYQQGLVNYNASSSLKVTVR